MRCKPIYRLTVTESDGIELRRMLYKPLITLLFLNTAFHCLLTLQNDSTVFSF